VREKGLVLLVEGYFDVLGAAAAGIDWVVASMGTSLTAEQARLLSRYADEVIVGYDGDRAGEEAYRRALPLLLAQGLAVKRLELGDGEDPDSLRFEEGNEALSARLEEAEDAVLREIRRLTPTSMHGDPQHQARAARAIGELLRSIADPVLRFGYGRKAADRLGVPVDLFMGRERSNRGDSTQRSEAAPGARLVRSAEERVLQLLLLGKEAPPRPEDLPSPEVFFDPTARNIYRAFCDLYSSGSAGRPGARAITAALETDSGAVDRLARLLLEEPVPSAGKELREALAQLDRRWQQQQLRRLAAQIDEAQRAGDRQKLERLLEEKTAVSKALHQRPSES
jgi:DNA primase